MVHYLDVVLVLMPTHARQAPLSMGLSRQEHWGGLLFPPLRDLPGPGIEPESLEVSCIGSWIPYQCTTWAVAMGRKAGIALEPRLPGALWSGAAAGRGNTAPTCPCVGVTTAGCCSASTTWRSGRSFWASIWMNLMLLPQTGN